MKLMALLCIVPVVLMAPPARADKDAQADIVVLLHGIGHSRWNMYGLERALRREGYGVLNLSYPSLRNDIGSLAAWLDAQLTLARAWDRPGKVHFVTHSMGGLVARRYLEDFRDGIPAEKMGRVVMIGPPNGGSEVADFLQDFPPYRWLFGPAGQELTTQERGLDASAPWYETGVIAGTRAFHPLGVFLIPGPHDGCVSVERARLQGMTDFIAVPAAHSFISWRGDVQGMVLRFLRDGMFGNASQESRAVTPVTPGRASSRTTTE